MSENVTEKDTQKTSDSPIEIFPQHKRLHTESKPSCNTEDAPEQTETLKQTALPAAAELPGPLDDMIQNFDSNSELELQDAPIIIKGTSGKDIIKIKEKPDRSLIVSLNGQEICFSAKEAERLQFQTDNGNDVIIADNSVTHNLHIIAGDGDNTIYTGSGNDHIEAGSGNNVIYTSDGNDTVITGNGDNVIFVGNGNNIVKTGNGHDRIYTGSGDNIISGINGDDTVRFGNGDAYLDIE